MIEKETPKIYLDATGKEIKLGKEVRLSEKCRDEYLSEFGLKENDRELEFEKKSVIEFRGIVESLNPDGTVTLKSANLNNKYKMEFDPENLVIE